MYFPNLNPQEGSLYGSEQNLKNKNQAKNTVTL